MVALRSRGFGFKVFDGIDGNRLFAVLKFRLVLFGMLVILFILVGLVLKEFIIG